MSFLTPLFLLGGLAVAAPIIYHLVRRTTRDRKVFSSLMFLMPSPPRLSKRHRLEHWLLLLLRCAALLLLALGFARPFLRQTPIVDPTAAEPRRVVVLVDQSASMRRAGAWAAATERVNAVLRAAGPADQVAVYTFDRQARPLLNFEDWNRSAPSERLPLALSRMSAVTPGWSGTHLGNALITAAEALTEDEGKSAPGPRQIVLVSDLQVGSRLDSLQSYEWPKGIELLVEPVKATSTTNAGVQLVAEAADSTRAADAPVRVRVTNAADSKREQFSLAWMRAAGATGNAAEVVGAPIEAYVPPGQSRVFSLPVPKVVGGVERITLRGDDEDFDNVAYVIPPTQQRAAVMWLGGEAQEDQKQPLFFLRRAFVDTPRIGVNVSAAAPATPVSAEQLASANLIFVSEPLPPAAAAGLRQQVEAGRTAVLVAKSTQLASTIAAIAGTAGQPLAMEEVKPPSYAMFSEIDFQHPLFAPFADPRFSDFTKIHIWKHRRIDPAALPNSRVVARFEGGAPALLDVPVGKGRVFVLTTSWHPDDSQLAVSSKFVPLLWSMLELAGGATTLATQYAVGAAIPLPAERGVTSVRVPGGQSVALDGKPAEFAATMQPGIYEATSTQPGPALRYAVNLDANESRTAPLGLDELEQLGVPLAKASAPAAKSQEATTLLQGVEAEGRQKLWRWFIVATLALLLIESALAGWTARRAGPQTQEAAS
jgi:hypothetical protein